MPLYVQQAGVGFLFAAKSPLCGAEMESARGMLVVVVGEKGGGGGGGGGGC